jgi:hypothetical protein
MPQQCHVVKMVEFLNNGSGDRLLIRIVRKLTIEPGSLLWLSLLTLPLGLPAYPQAQQPPVVQAPGTESPVIPQLLSAGSISGTVMDGTGAVILGAQITLTRAGQSAPQQMLSGDYGQFSFANVLPGTFQIGITASGFAVRTFTGILRSGQVYIVPCTLAPETLRTEIVVTVPLKEVAEEQIKAQEKQRVLAVIPNFYVSYVRDAAPLTSKQKFRLAWKTMIDPVTFALTGATAGVQQAQDDFSTYGQGAQGYAKRFAASYADNVAGTFIGSAILPSLLKQDPRYFYKGTGSTGSRILYALSSSVICRGDNLRRQPNYSAILGSMASGGISYLYYPAQDRGAARVFGNVLFSIGEAAVVNLFQEFVIRKFTTNVPKRKSSHP